LTSLLQSLSVDIFERFLKTVLNHDQKIKDYFANFVLVIVFHTLMPLWLDDRKNIRLVKNPVQQ